MASSTTYTLRYMKSGLKYMSATALTIFTASMTSATYYRPIPSNNSNDNNSNSNDDRRLTQTFCSPNSPPWNRDHVPLLLQWARGISIGVTTLAIRLVMNTYGRYTIREDEHYERFLEVATASTAITTADNRILDNDNASPSNKRGLLTVSNHRSLFDDPGILSCLLPLPIAIQPRHQRWGICSQEYCFNDALPAFIKGYIGAGQVLPICRGGGINQRLLLDFGRHLANGEWCHVFPEGGVWQWNELGGRRLLDGGMRLGNASDFATPTEQQQDVLLQHDYYYEHGDDDSIIMKDKSESTSSSSSNNNKRKNNNTNKVIIPATTAHKQLHQSPIGKLKWGVGKLIAHAPITPHVIPFAHHGMERLLPQDEVSGKTYLRRDFVKSLLPSFLLGNDYSEEGGEDDGKGLRIQVQFGKEIHFDDLIQEHEVKYGKLWKYRGKEPTAADVQGKEEDWVSSREEKILYSKIVKRIEMHLEVLTRNVCR